MAERAYRYCKEPNCGVRFRGEGWYCPAHKTSNTVTQEQARRRSEDPIWKLYHCARWSRFTLKFKSENPICQRLRDGVRCTNPTTELHHLVSPRKAPEKMYNQTNVVGLCVHCHVTAGGAEPVANLSHLQDFYAPTVWKPIQFF
jgi:5-methylcytosine-specific restriction endonuclease McrA